MNNYYYDFSGYYPKYVLIDLEPVLEISDFEFNEWCRAYHIYGAAAYSCISNILKHAMAGETLAQVSARLGYGNNCGKDCKEYYYNHHIFILEDNEI